MLGKETILSTQGPMCVDRDTMEYFCQVVLAAEPWLRDPSLNLRQWVPYKFDKPLKIAVQWSDGVVQPHPPMIRALREVAAACKAAGMNVIDWDCTKLRHDYAWDLTASLYWPDGGEEVLGYLNDAAEPVLPLTKFIINEQPSVKKMSVAELFAVSVPCQDFYLHLLTLPSAPKSGMTIAPSMPKPGPIPPPMMVRRSTSYFVPHLSAPLRLMTSLVTGATPRIGISLTILVQCSLSRPSIRLKIRKTRPMRRRTNKTVSATTCTRPRCTRTRRSLCKLLVAGTLTKRCWQH
jgi:hypothetical protein